MSKLSIYKKVKMKQAITNIIFIVIPIILVAWAFLATTYYLGCKSYERFDKAQTRYIFPGLCYADFGKGYVIRY